MAHKKCSAAGPGRTLADILPRGIQLLAECTTQPLDFITFAPSAASCFPTALQAAGRGFLAVGSQAQHVLSQKPFAAAPGAVPCDGE